MPRTATKPRQARTGFTLPELLITMLILGEIATFTIPKVIFAQQNNIFNARTKEAVGMMSAAHQQAFGTGTLTTSTTMGNLTQYLNYVRYDTSSTVDGIQTVDSYSCSVTGSYGCYRLHNGATLITFPSTSFGGSGSTNAIAFAVDPDSVYSGTTNGQGKSQVFFLMYNGRITTYGNLPGTVCNSSYCSTQNASYDTTWFSW